ncbi:MAG: stage II sporulation protein R [Bacilli bacterium]|nr:stage II sporulation protein R [Bacilli bacterium]
MKKTILLLLLIFGTYFSVSKLIESKELIPKDAIRMRVIGNSDSVYDQNVKMKVKEKVEKEVFSTLKNTKGIKEARTKIKKELPNLDKSVLHVLQDEKTSLVYNIHYGMNYFPEKEFRGVTYKEGEYESLVVTLGEGKGSNWWCVLFPPLCLVEATESSDVEYKLFIEEMMDKYL